MSKNKIEKTRRNFLIKSVAGMAVVPALALGGAALNAAEALSAANTAGTTGTTGATGGQAKEVQPAAGYRPAFFNPEEFAFIRAAVSRLIPKDNLGPGALEAGAPEYIDRQMQTPYGVAANWYMQGPFRPDADPTLGYQLPLKPQEIYRLGIAEANAFARKQHNAPFSELSAAQQDELLGLMESGKANFDKLPARVFFATLLQNTREGFFCDPVHGGNKGLVGWSLIGFPGARADYMDWVERGEKYPFPSVSISGERG